MVLKMSEYPSAGQSKALQNIVAMACWMEIVEQETTSSKNLHSILEQIYIGDQENEDLLAKRQEFLLGTGRFRHIWSLLVVASDSLDHIIAFINFKIFLNSILSN